MKTVIIKSILVSVVALVLMYLVRTFFRTDLFIADVGGLGTFLSVFGTLYGILAAFVVFEVWGEFNKTQNLIDQEASGLERLFRLTLYFRDSKLTKKMKETIVAYAKIVIEGKFRKIGGGERNVEAGKTFRNIAQIIREVTFDDDHDHVVFDHIVAHYGHLSEVRAERITQSLQRLPVLLKAFLYISSTIVLITLIAMPFANQYYGFAAVLGLSFILAMVVQLVEDLDNPFVGQWNITPEPFVRALKHIEEDY
jgi:hypothetical protein